MSDPSEARDEEYLEIVNHFYADEVVLTSERTRSLVRGEGCRAFTSGVFPYPASRHGRDRRDEDGRPRAANRQRQPE